MATIKQAKPIKIGLDQKALDKEFFDDIKMLSIICPHEPYHLAWHINRTLPFTFTRTPEQDILVDNEYYVVCSFIDTNNLIEHYLIACRAKTRFILPDLKNFDFIWMIKGGHLVDNYIKQYPSIIKSIPGVVDCRSIDHEKLSQRQVFLL